MNENINTASIVIITVAFILTFIFAVINSTRKTKERITMVKRKIKLVEIDPEFISDCIKTTGDDCIILDVKGVPKNAKLVQTGYDYDRHLIVCMFEHKSFDEVPEFNIIPKLNIEFKRYYI